MKLPPFVYAKAFWEAFSFLAAGALGLLVFFKVIPENFGLPAASILLGILAVLRFFGIIPELKAKELLDELKDARDIW